MKILKISIKEMNSIIEKLAPTGLFWCIDKGMYIGCDNENHDAFVEEFKTKEDLMSWLNPQHIKTNKWAQFGVVFHNDNCWCLTKDIHNNMNAMRYKDGLRTGIQTLKESSGNRIEKDTDWIETHHEIVNLITIQFFNDIECGVVFKTQQERGQGGIYELAEDWTNEFQEKYKDEIWGEVEYLPTIKAFFNAKNNPKVDFGDVSKLHYLHCSDEMKRKILYLAENNEAVQESIDYAIKFHADELKVQSIVEYVKTLILIDSEIYLNHDTKEENPLKLYIEDNDTFYTVDDCNVVRKWKLIYSFDFIELNFKNRILRHRGLNVNDAILTMYDIFIYGKHIKEVEI